MRDWTSVYMKVHGDSTCMFIDFDRTIDTYLVNSFFQQKPSTLFWRPREINQEYFFVNEVSEPDCNTLNSHILVLSCTSFSLIKSKNVHLLFLNNSSDMFFTFKKHKHTLIKTYW